MATSLIFFLFLITINLNDCLLHADGAVYAISIMYGTYVAYAFYAIYAAYAMSVVTALYAAPQYMQCTQSMQYI